MEKSQFELCIKVLRKFDQAGILSHIVLAGSWSVYFYRYYFNSESYISAIRTRDIDFVVPIPFNIKNKTNVVSLLEPLNFDVEFSGTNGLMKLHNPELTVEFLVPELGRGSEKPYKLPDLGINAVQLRYLSMLVDNTVKIKAEGISVTIPHPAAYALHKFIIFKRRKNKEKVSRDVETAKRVFIQLMDSPDKASIGRVYKSLHLKWRKTIIENLKSIGEEGIVADIASFDL